MGLFDELFEETTAAPKAKRGDVITVVDLDRTQRRYIVMDVQRDDPWTQTVSLLADPENA